MNKLITNITGGFPFALDDLRFMDDSVRLAIADVCKTIAGHAPTKLYGCELSNYATYIAVSEGAILLDGEVYHVYPHNIALNGAITQYYWNFISANDPAGSKTFENGETHQVYEIRKAVGTINAPLAGALASIIMSEVVDLSSILRDNVIITPASPFVKAPLTWQNIAILDRGRVSIELGISAVVGFGGQTLIATLPVGYRPKQAVGGACMAEKSDGTHHFAGYTITTDGRIELVTPSMDSGDEFTVYLVIPPYLVP